MIVVDNTNKVYADQHVLQDFNFTFSDHGSYALLGANGAGKSTLIKSMVGLIHLSSGSVSTEKTYVYVSEQPRLPETMTPLQLLEYACRVRDVSKKTAIERLIEVQLKEPAWKQPISHCSKGMKQRVAIAYALVGEPDWFILDEPMSGLDVMGRALILDIFKKRKDKGCGIIMCSHSVADITKLCKEVLIMVNGKLKETLKVEKASLAEADFLETRLKHWYGNEIND